MPSMPNLETFSSGVPVEGARPVGSYDISPLVRGNAAITQGVETLGKGMQSAGADAGAVADANDRYNFAIAKASFNIDHTNLQDSLKHDQDYATLQPRYMEGAQAAQSRWADTITNPRTRQLFNAQTGEAIAQGDASTKAQAFSLEGSTKLADVDDRGKSLSDGAIANPMDEATFGKNLEQYGDMVDALVAKGYITPTQAAAKKDAWAHSAGVGVGLARADIDPTGAINEVRAMPGSPDQVTNRIMQNEGPGKDPRSSAVGGFIDSTWLDLIKQNRPDLAQGKSDADLLALRADPGLRRDMTQAYQNQNSAYLKSQGLEATPGNQYLAHFLGPAGAAAVLQAKPNAPVADVLASVVGPQKAQAMIDANPTILQGKLAGSVAQWANGKMGGAIPGDGHIYDWLDDNQRRQIASYAQNKLDANQLDQNSQLKQHIEDTAAEAARTGYATNPVSQSEFVATQGLVDGPKNYAQYQAGLKLSADVSNVARMTEAQQNELLKSYTPVAGEGYAAASDRQTMLAKAIQTVRKERDADPATFAINRIPAVKSAFQNFDQLARDPQATPDAKALAARDYVNKTTERQVASGVAPEDVKVVPQGYVDGLDKAFTAAATATDATARVNLIARINQEKALWGDDVWPSLVRQLPATTQPVVRAIAAGADPVAMARLLALGKDENPAAILKEQNEVTARNMTAALNSSFAPFKGSMVGAQLDRDFKGYSDLGQKLAALYVRDGQPAETAADNAFKALVGDRYDFRDTYRIPKDPHVDPDAVQRGTLAARGEIITGAGSSFADLRPQINDIGLSDNEGDSRRNFARDGIFVTSPRNDGLNIAYKNEFLSSKSGQRILLTWPLLAAMGNTREGQAAGARESMALSPVIP